MKVDELDEVLGRLNAATPMIAASTKGLVAAQVVAVDDLKILVGAIAALRAAQPRIPEPEDAGRTDAVEIARGIVAKAQSRCSVDGIGMSWGCIRHIRSNDGGEAGGELIADIAAALRAAQPRIPEPVDGMSQEPRENKYQELARFEEALTPSTETKRAYMGEFSFHHGEFDGELTVPWTTIKEIMAAILARASAPAPAAKPTVGLSIKGAVYDIRRAIQHLSGDLTPDEAKRSLPYARAALHDALDNLARASAPAPAAQPVDGAGDAQVEREAAKSGEGGQVLHPPADRGNRS